jgi:hypothetical protein
MLDHGRRMIDLFGEEIGIRQMRKWTSWYTKGFRGSSGVRPLLMKIETLAEIPRIVAALDLSEPFPEAALRVHRGKGSKSQRVKLPEGYLDDLDDDTPPKGPRTLAEIESWERALGGG